MTGLAQAANVSYREAELPGTSVRYREAVLPGASGPEEIHLGSDGMVWISNYDPGQIWQVNPATGAFGMVQKSRELD